MKATRGTSSRPSRRAFAPSPFASVRRKSAGAEGWARRDSVREHCCTQPGLLRELREGAAKILERLGSSGPVVGRVQGDMERKSVVCEDLDVLAAEPLRARLFREDLPCLLRLCVCTRQP